MSVRRANEEDVELVAELGHRFIHAADMPPASIEECREFVGRLLQAKEAGVFITARGVIAGVLAPLYYRPDYKQAVELFWWSEDRQGLKLLQAFEQWAFDAGANDVNMSTLDHFTPPGVQKLLTKRGYLLRDKTFRKRLGT